MARSTPSGYELRAHSGPRGAGRQGWRTGSNWENGYNGSFNGKLRDELLNGENFYTLKEAKVLIER